MVVPDSIRDKVGPLPDVSSMNKGLEKYKNTNVMHRASHPDFNSVQNQMVFPLITFNHFPLS